MSDGLHQPVSGQQFVENVLQQIFRIDFGGNTLPNKGEEAFALTLEGEGETLVLICTVLGYRQQFISSVGKT